MLETVVLCLFVAGILILCIAVGERLEKTEAPHQIDTNNHPQIVATKLQRIERTARLISSTHASTLASLKLQKTKCDPYGNKDDIKWKIERQNFINKMLVTNSDIVTLGRFDKSDHRGLLHRIVEEAASTAPAPSVQRTSSGSTASRGVAYEHLCRKILIDCGWTVQTTTATGDQGADLLALRNGVTVVVQCKDYSSAVGNKAVQEVAAARKHYRYEHAVVVARNGYTSSARELSATNSVVLIHHFELRDLARHLLF